MTGSGGERETLFTSDRERRLWIWTLVVVGAVYSTLGLARSLATWIEARDLLVWAFVLGMALVSVSIVALSVQRWPRMTEVAVALGVGAVLLMALQRTGMDVERSHLFEYAIVAIFVYAALAERSRNGRRLVGPPAVVAIAVATTIGVLDEAIQAIVPFRVFDPVDMLFNSLAVIAAVAASVAVGWATKSRA